MKPLQTLFEQFILDESGVTAIEYALLGSLIAVLIVAAVLSVGTSMSTMYDRVSNAVKAAVSGP